MRKVLRTTLLIVLFGVLIYSMTHIVLTETEYKRAEAIYDKSRSESFHISDTVQPASALSEANEYFPDASVDFEMLKSTNAEVVGWIWIGETNINFPLLRGEDNRKYLNLSYDLQQTNSGSIFMDFRNSPDLSSVNTVIYGHNMKSGGMFGELKKFGEPEYLKQHCDLYIFTETCAFKYRIFAAYKTESESKSYTLDFSKDFSYNDFIEYAMSFASDEGSAAPSEITKLITLSTCTSGRRNERFVVHAFLIAAKSTDAFSAVEPIPTGNAE